MKQRTVPSAPLPRSVAVPELYIQTPSRTGSAGFGSQLRLQTGLFPACSAALPPEGSVVVFTAGVYSAGSSPVSAVFPRVDF